MRYDFGVIAVLLHNEINDVVVVSGETSAAKVTPQKDWLFSPSCRTSITVMMREDSVKFRWKKGEEDTAKVSSFNELQMVVCCVCGTTFHIQFNQRVFRIIFSAHKRLRDERDVLCLLSSCLTMYLGCCVCDFGGIVV